MKRKWYKGQFGVELASIADEFLPYPFKLLNFDLRKFGIRSVPVIGRVSYLQAGEPSSWHVHDGCLEFIYCHSGTCEYECDGQRYALRPGMVYFSRMNEAHRQVTCPKGFGTYYLLYRPDRAETSLWLKEAFGRLPRLFAGRPAVAALFREILALAASGKPKAELRFRLETSVRRLFLELVDSASARTSRTGAAAFDAIARRMRERPADDYPLADLVAESGVSRASFIATFKRLFGYAPHAYLLLRRVEAAKRLLRTGKTVEQVAAQLSFPSASHFVRTFSNHTGTPPAKWRTAKLS